MRNYRKAILFAVVQGRLSSRGLALGRDPLTRLTKHVKMRGTLSTGR